MEKRKPVVLWPGICSTIVSFRYHFILGVSRFLTVCETTSAFLTPFRLFFTSPFGGSSAFRYPLLGSFTRSAPLLLPLLVGKLIFAEPCFRHGLSSELTSGTAVKERLRGPDLVSWKIYLIGRLWEELLCFLNSEMRIVGDEFKERETCFRYTYTIIWNFEITLWNKRSEDFFGFSVQKNFTMSITNLKYYFQY